MGMSRRKLLVSTAVPSIFHFKNPTVNKEKIPSPKKHVLNESSDNTSSIYDEETISYEGEEQERVDCVMNIDMEIEQNSATSKGTQQEN